MKDRVKKRLLILKALVSLAIGLSFYASLIFVPTFIITGGIDWSRGWKFMVLYTGSSLLLGAWLYILDPGLLSERVKTSFGENFRDAAASIFLVVTALVWCVLIPIDVHVLRLIPDLPGALGQWIGVGLFGVGFALIIWTFDHNSFATPTVKVQKERGQWVIDTGPYAYVRHPMYAGMFPYFAGTALFLGSPALALLSVPMFMVALLPRIVLEEAELAANLDDYAEYLEDVRWRLIPKVY